MENSFSSRRWTNQTSWMKSRSENILLNPGTSNRGESHEDFLGESEGSLPPPHDSFPDAGEAINDFWSNVEETSDTAITLNPESNFTRREKNHSLFHWNTLTSPELHIQIWMSSKRNASMIIGMSMGQETCLILGQGHSVYFIGRETSRRICVVRWETDKTAGNIQARSFMARALDKIGKKIRTIHYNFGKLHEELSWNHRTATPHRSETSEIAERAVRRVKEETSAVLLQSGWNENWRADSMRCYCYLAKCPRPPGRRENSVWKTIWWTIQRASNSIWSNGWIWHDF